ncbi:hypothetical protein Tco_0576181 [Tanacetum coccineum]
MLEYKSMKELTVAFNGLKRRQKREIKGNTPKCHTADKVKEGSDGKDAEVLKNHSPVTSLKVDDMRKYSCAHVERNNILDFLMGSFLINHNQVVGFKECKMPARVGDQTSGMSSQGNIDHRRMLAQGKCHKLRHVENEASPDFTDWNRALSEMRSDIWLDVKRRVVIENAPECYSNARSPEFVTFMGPKDGSGTVGSSKKLECSDKLQDSLEVADAEIISTSDAHFLPVRDFAAAYSIIYGLTYLGGATTPVMWLQPWHVLCSISILKHPMADGRFRLLMLVCYFPVVCKACSLSWHLEPYSVIHLLIQEPHRMLNTQQKVVEELLDVIFLKRWSPSGLLYYFDAAIADGYFTVLPKVLYDDGDEDVLNLNQR